MQMNYIGRWLFTDPNNNNRGQEFQVTSFDRTRGIATTDLPGHMEIPLMELDFNTARYMPLRAPIEVPEIANELKAIAGSVGLINKSKEPTTEQPPIPPQEINNTLSGNVYNTSPTTHNTEGATEPSTVVDKVIQSTDTETALIINAITLSKEKSETDLLTLTIPINIDFNLTRIVSMCDSLGVRPEKAIDVILQMINIDSTQIKEQIRATILTAAG